MLIHSHYLILQKNSISALALSTRVLLILARADQLVCSQDRVQPKQTDQSNDLFTDVSLRHFIKTRGQSNKGSVIFVQFSWIQFVFSYWKHLPPFCSCLEYILVSVLSSKPKTLHVINNWVVVQLHLICSQYSVCLTNSNPELNLFRFSFQL